MSGDIPYGCLSRASDAHVHPVVAVEGEPVLLHDGVQHEAWVVVGPVELVVFVASTAGVVAVGVVLLFGLLVGQGGGGLHVT